MIKAVFFYLGGLLVESQISSMSKYIANMFNVKPKQMEESIVKHRAKVQRGTGTEEEMWINVCKELDIAVPNKPFREIYDEAWDEGYKEFPETIAIAKKLKEKGYKIGVISNSEKKTINSTKKIDRLISMFDYSVLSYNYGLRANEQNGKLFKCTSKVSKVKDEEVLIIFGKQKTNSLSVVESLGLKKEGKHYRFKNSKLRAIICPTTKKLISNLKDFDIKI